MILKYYISKVKIIVVVVGRASSVASVVVVAGPHFLLGQCFLLVRRVGYRVQTYLMAVVRRLREEVLLFLRKPLLVYVEPVFINGPIL